MVAGFSELSQEQWTPSYVPFLSSQASQVDAENVTGDYGVTLFIASVFETTQRSHSYDT